jgi:hypothetical protein
LKKMLLHGPQLTNGPFGMPLPRERHLDCDAKRIWHGVSKAKAKRSLPGEEASLSSPITNFQYLFSSASLCDLCGIAVNLL